MATKGVKKAVVLAGVLLLVIHFTIILIFNAPNNWFNEKVNFHVRQYVVPVFHQNFKIFAPDPPVSNNYFAFRCKLDNEDWSSWKIPDLKYLHQHQQNRFSYYGKKYNVYESIGRNLYYIFYKNYSHEQRRSLSDGQRKKIAFAQTEKTPSYELAKRYSLDKGNELFPDKTISAIQFAYAFDYIKKDSVQTIVFPEILIHEE